MKRGFVADDLRNAITQLALSVSERFRAFRSIFKRGNLEPRLNRRYEKSMLSSKVNLREGRVFTKLTFT
jgi:hypothetical protein